MDVSVLHTATEDLASFLSEATVGDLGCFTPCQGWDLRRLYQHLIDENVRVALAVAVGSVAPQWSPGPHRTDLLASADAHGGGLDREYLVTARLMKDAFASITDADRSRHDTGSPGEHDLDALYEMQICNTVIHTWDLAQALGFPYEPDPHVADLVLTRMRQVPDATHGRDEALMKADSGAGESTFERILTLSGRRANPGL